MLNFKNFNYPSFFEKLDAGRMHYIEIGSANERPTLLMVHGNPTWSYYYRHFIEAFKEKFHIIAIDHLGCGLSDKPQKYFQLKDRIDHLSSFIEKKKLKNICLIAHDWGGAIGMGSVVRSPKLFSHIVLGNTGSFTSKDIPKRIALCKIPLIGKFLNQGLNVFCLAATFMSSEKKLSSEEKKMYLLPYNNFKNRLAVNNFVKDIPLHKGHPSYHTLKEIEDLTPSLNQNFLFLWGMKDFCFNYKFLNRYEELIKNYQKVTYNDAGHYVYEDKKDECVIEINNFLDE